MELAIFSPGAEVGRARRHVALAIISSLLIIMPHIFHFVQLPVMDLEENRTLAPAPEVPIDFSGLQTLPQKIDAYIADNFPLRSQIIASMNYVRFLAHYSTTKSVIVGKDGWLFYDNGTHLAHGLGRTRLSLTTLNDWVVTLERRVDYAKSQGIGFYVLPAPQQETIYPEKLPSWLAQRVQPTTEVDQIIQAAADRGLDQIVDVRPPLIAAKAARDVYGPYDIHWNGDGAYIAYRELMMRISRDYPDLAPLAQPNFMPVPKWARPRVLSRMLGIADFVEHKTHYYGIGPIGDEKRTTYLSDRRDWNAPRILDTDSTSNRTLLLMRDSFGTELIPLLKPQFRRIIITPIPEGFRGDLIEQYRPNIVIVEVIENGLRFVMK